ncbi:MAG: pro-sigmaK processing inhibitor BofA family protein [Bacilli bacterium]
MKQILTKFLNIFKWILKSFLFGIVTLFIFNFIGSYINLNIPVNIITIFIIGILRIPGLAAIMIYNIL